MLDLVLEILSFFGLVYDADQRPEARVMTVGCAVVCLLGIVAVVLVMRFAR